MDLSLVLEESPDNQIDILLGQFVATPASVIPYANAAAASAASANLSMTNAGLSATGAATSATNAATSATNAATSASNAAGSASAAAASATSAAFNATLTTNPIKEIFNVGTGFTVGAASITLANSYGSIDNIDLYADGVPQLDSTLTGLVLGFPNGGCPNVAQIIVRGRRALAIGVPSTGTVVDASVAATAAINATKLLYVSPLAGTVARTVASKESDFINAREFGVKADGVTDDSVALNLALNTVAGLNGTLCLPQGTILASGLSVNQPGHFLTLRGAGMFATTLVTNSPSGDFLTFQTAGYELKDLQLSANVTRVSGSHFTTTSNQGLINNVGINAALTGIIMQDGFCSMRKLTFTSPIAGTISMIINGAGAGMVIDDMTCYTGVTGTASAGIKVVNAGSVQISNSNIVGQGFDLWIAPGTGQGVASIYALNTFFDTATSGVVIAPTGTGFVDRCRFDSCWMCSHSANGILIQNSGTGTIGGIHFIDCEASFCASGSGFIVVAAGGPLPTDVSILGGIFSGNTNGIQLPAGMSDFTIMGTTAGLGGDAAANSGFGIFLAPGASDHYIISNNRVRGNGLGSVSDGGTGTNKSVTANIT